MCGIDARNIHGIGGDECAAPGPQTREPMFPRAVDSVNAGCLDALSEIFWEVRIVRQTKPGKFGIDTRVDYRLWHF